MTQNVETKIEGTTLVIRVDLTKDFGLSKTGKSHIVATTAGFAKVDAAVPGNISFGLNVIRTK